jgi:Phosphoenolpyruvate phosphomutase
VVMEDKTFPKDSSLRPGGRQVLVPVEEFQGKVEAARLSGGPIVVARTEALIAGLGQDEALRRGAAYVEAGADAVLIHSKQKTPDEILDFCRAWPGQVPLVLVPTSYPQLSFGDVAGLGKVGLIICANHAIRAAVAAMRATFARILAEDGIAGVEDSIAKVSDIFALQGDDRMRELEARFCADFPRESREKRGRQVRTRLAAGGRWIRTVGPPQHYAAGEAGVEHPVAAETRFRQGWTSIAPLADSRRLTLRLAVEGSPARPAKRSISSGWCLVVS